MLQEIELKNLVENDYNPRKRFDDARFAELKESIARVGLIQPLTVRKNDGQYEVVCGVRRLRALRALDKEKRISTKKVPCNILKVNDDEAQILSISENTARDDLTAIEEARSYAGYLNLDNLDLVQIPSQDHSRVRELSDKIGKGADVISHRIRLLVLPEDVQIMVENKEILLRPAEIIAGLRQIKDEEYRNDLMRRLANNPSYKGSEPDISALRNDVQRYIKDHEKEDKKQKNFLKEYEDMVSNREVELSKITIETADWTKKMDVEYTPINGDIDREAIALIEALQDVINTLGTNEFDELDDRRIELDEMLHRLEQNLKIVTGSHLSKCPFCFADVYAPDIKERINNIDIEIDSIQESKGEIDKKKKEFEEKRADLRKALKRYQQAKDIYDQHRKRMKG